MRPTSVSAVCRSNCLLIPSAKKRMAMNRQLRSSCRWQLVADAISRAVIQQLVAAAKYSATVSQPTKVGSPIPGVQLNDCCISDEAAQVSLRWLELVRRGKYKAADFLSRKSACCTYTRPGTSGPASATARERDANGQAQNSQSIVESSADRSVQILASKFSTALQVRNNLIRSDAQSLATPSARSSRTQLIHAHAGDQRFSVPG